MCIIKLATMIDTIKLKSYAKINLSLDILDKEICGLHNIDTIVTSINIYDIIKINKRADKAINVIYENLNNIIENDTSKKMALLLQKEYDTSGVDIYIKKHIPFQAGLGGSSADAAGVAVGMQKLFDIQNIPSSLLLQVGSDVPYMYKGGTRRVRGKGEVVESLNSFNAFIAIIICPGGVNTAEAYALYDVIGGETCNISKIIDCLINNRKVSLCNSLQRAAIELNKNIRTGLDYLEQAGFSQKVMSGSGSAVLGIMHNETQFNQSISTLKKILPEKYKLYTDKKGRSNDQENL